MSLTTWQQEEELDPEQENANFTHERRLTQQAQQLQQAAQQPPQRLQQPADDQGDDVDGDFFSKLPGNEEVDGE